MRESRTYGSGRGACHETHVPTATTTQFITIGGAAAVWSLAALAAAAIPVIGFLHSASAGPNVLNVAEFQRGLSESGFIDGQNLRIEYHWAENQYDRLPELAADLVRRQVAVMVTAGSTASALAAKAATSTIPIVFGIGEDPVQLGLVASLNRPGGNVTGVTLFTTEVVAKRLGLLHELVPGATRVAVLVNPTEATRTESTVRDVKTAARASATATIPIIFLAGAARVEGPTRRYTHSQMLKGASC